MGIIDCTPELGAESYGPNSKEGRMQFGTCVDMYQTKEIMYPEKGHILAPWVAIDFVDQVELGGTGAAITVGNLSSDSTDPKNCAVIKSFEFGHSDGFEVHVTIHDTHGGSFEEFVKHLLKDWLCLKDTVSAQSVLMRFQFGWVKSGADRPLPRSQSQCYYAMCKTIDSTFVDGKFIFQITSRDITFSTFEGAYEYRTGGDGEKSVHLMHAIRELITDSSPPNVGDVVFKMAYNGSIISSDDPITSGQEPPRLFTGLTKKEQWYGPKRKWDAKGQSKLEAIRRWVNDCPSYNGRSWVPQYNPDNPGGTLVWWENNSPFCDNQTDGIFDATSLGTYIVNGGPSSPVIEFNPRLNWNFASVTATGGNTGNMRKNSMGTEGGKNTGHPCLPREAVEGAGQLQLTNPSEGVEDEFGSDAVQVTATNDAEAKKTIVIGGTDRDSYYNNIDADLVIIGDPTFAPPSEARIQKNISIVLINPFHLVPNDDDEADWLAKPACNAVLSNKGWIITGVKHTIDAGKYTTTVSVKLSTPGVDLPASKRFGAWMGGWTPVGICWDDNS